MIEKSSPRVTEWSMVWSGGPPGASWVCGVAPVPPAERSSTPPFVARFVLHFDSRTIFLLRLDDELVFLSLCR
jgi:hypothetical protein